MENEEGWTKRKAYNVILETLGRERKLCGEGYFLSFKSMSELPNSPEGEETVVRSLQLPSCHLSKIVA
jgi:hypothetical protein